MQKHLTDLSIKKLSEGVYNDTKTPAFGIRIGKRRRTWFVTHPRTRIKKTLGHYPEMTLSEARRRAFLVLSNPTNPNVAITFPEALEAFLALDRWRPHTKRTMISNFRKFTWKRPLSKISHEDVMQVLDDIQHPSSRFHAFKDLRALFNWCVPRYISSSPCEGIKMDIQPTRSRILTDDELKELWNALGDSRGDKLIRLLILTGQRRGEICYMKLEGDLITIDGQHTKNGRTHIFPAGEFTKRFFEVTPYNGWSNARRSINKRVSIQDWTLHDLRRTFASNHARLGTPIHITEKLLNHVSGTFSGVAGIYNRYSYQDEMAIACKRYEDWLSSGVLMG